MRALQLPVPLAYLAALAAPLVATVIQELLLPEPHVAPFVLFFPTVALVAWLGGRLPGLASALLSTLIGNYVFMLPHAFGWSLDRQSLVASALFLASSSMIALLCGALRSAFLELQRLGEEQARAARALNEVQADLNRAQAVAETGSWRLDVRRGVLRWSDEVYRLFGIAPGTPMSYETFLACVHPQDREAVDRAWTAALRGAHYEIEHRIVVDGAVRWVRERAELERDSDGTLLGGFGTVQDITERRRGEEALREADRRKNEFLAVLSHELRNPLAPIRSSVFVLEHTPPAAEQARRAQAVIERQVGHLTRIVDDLLDVTRISRGKIRLQRRPLELGELVRRAVEDRRDTLSTEGIALEAHLPPGALWVDADPTRIEQVVSNLLSNAEKFSKRGGRVLVTLEQEGKQAALRVRDWGAGIEPDMLERLFQPFMQADHTLARSRGGLGLGLALVKGVVELHGGTVMATSEGPDMGAEFTVRLPLAPAARVSAEPAESRGARGRRILVIEDSEDAAMMLKAALELMGHEVRVALDGLEGLTAARDFAPEIVLCDIGLPGMDGYEVARTFRADPSLGQPLLVALTGYARPEDRQRAFDAGFSQHVAKPPSLDALEELFAAA